MPLRQGGEHRSFDKLWNDRILRRSDDENKNKHHEPQRLQLLQAIRLKTKAASLKIFKLSAYFINKGLG